MFMRVNKLVIVGVVGYLIFPDEINSIITIEHDLQVSLFDHLNNS